MLESILKLGEVAEKYGLTENFDRQKFYDMLLEESSDYTSNVLKDMKRFFKEYSFGNNFLLHEVIQQKKGDCLGLTTLFKLFNHKPDVIYLPNHLTLRWNGKNYEPTNRASMIADETYIKLLNIPENKIGSVFFRSIEWDGILVLYLNQLASRLNKRAYRAEAMKLIELALSIDDSFPEVHFNKGVINLESGNLQEALEDFNQAIELNPRYAEAYLNRGVVKNLMGIRDHNDMRIALKLKPYLKRMGRPLSL